MSESDATFLRRIANKFARKPADAKRLTQMADTLARKAKRDAGLEACEACGKWEPFDTMSSTDDDCYLCKSCVTELEQEV